METNQVAQAQASENALTFITPDGKIAGLECYDGSEFRLPYLVLVQTTAQQEELKAPVGSFYNTVTGESSKTIEGVIVAVQQNRRWTVDYLTSQALKQRNEPVPTYCQSSNGKTPDGTGTMTPPSTACKTCPKAKFGQKPDGTPTAPECTDFRKVLIALADGTLAIFSTKKEGGKVFDAFVQPFFALRKPTFSVAMTLTSKGEKNTRGEFYYVPEVKAHHDKPVTVAEQRRLYEQIALYSTFMKINVADDQAEGEGTVDQAAAPGYVDTTAQAAAPTYQPEAPAAAPAPQANVEIPVQAEVVAPAPQPVVEAQAQVVTPQAAPAPVEAPQPVAQAAPVQQPAPQPVAQAPAVIYPADPVPLAGPTAQAVSDDEEAPF